MVHNRQTSFNIPFMYHHQTLVDIKHAVSTTLYQPVEYSTVLNDTWESASADYSEHFNHSTVMLRASPQMTSTAQHTWDKFEWPTETQMYTTALNATTTTVVENALPML